MEMENMSPIQLAKHLIDDEVNCGFEVEEIRKSWRCMCSSEYHVQIGGWINEKHYNNDKIIVSCFQGEKCLIIFPIQKIINLIKSKQLSFDL